MKNTTLKLIINMISRYLDGELQVKNPSHTVSLQQEGRARWFQIQKAGTVVERKVMHT